MSITISSKGDWQKTTKWLENHKKISIDYLIQEYADIGLQALRNATPVRTGKTRDSWYYSIDKSVPGQTTINWCNSNVNKGSNIALLIQYGHGTGNGTFINGVDYINPVMKPVFDALSERAYKEVIVTYGN